MQLTECCHRYVCPLALTVQHLLPAAEWGARAPLGLSGGHLISRPHSPQHDPRCQPLEELACALSCCRKPLCCDRSAPIIARLFVHRRELCYCCPASSGLSACCPLRRSPPVPTCPLPAPHRPPSFPSQVSPLSLTHSF